MGDLCEAYGVVNAAAHDAEGDAVAAARLMLAMARGSEELAGMALAELYEQERVWHKHFIGGLNDSKLRKGYASLEDHEFEWPIPAPPGTLF